MFVNYVREINAFNRFANDNYLGSSERLLWFGLMDYVNLTFASGSEWPGEFVSIPNKKLLSHVPFAEDAMIDARNRLKQRGLLDYIPGKKNKEAPKYKICYFAASQFSTGYQQDIGTSYPDLPGNVPGNVPGNMPGNVPGNVPGNMPGNVPGRVSDINLNVNYNRNPNPYVNVPDDDAEGEERARADARGAVESAFRLHIGRSATMAEINRLSVVCVTLGMSTEVLQEAVQEAAVHGAKNPAQYAIHLLNDWSAEYIRTKADLDDYRVMYDMHRGRGPFWANSVTYDEMQEAREKRRIANEGA